MTFVDRDTDLKMVVDDSVLDTLYDHAKTHLPNEFGGYLIGKYSDDLKCCYVKTFLLPLVYKSSPTGFVASPEGLEKDFANYYQNEKLYYIGEWHSHPYMPPTASATDQKAMIQISEDDCISISNPIMIIIGAYETQYYVSAYVQLNKKLIQYDKN